MTGRSENAALVDRGTFVTGHATMAKCAAVRKRLLAPKVTRRIIPMGRVRTVAETAGKCAESGPRT
jgi:hypothetical protein